MESLKKKLGYQLNTKGRIVGKITDFTIDEENWKVKHMIVKPKYGDRSKEVLVPAQILKADVRSQREEIRLHIPKNIFRNLPYKKEIPPVSLEQEMYLSKKTGWLSSLKEKLLKGPLPNKYVKDTLDYVAKPTNNHLRSFKELQKYSVFTESGELGKVEDFILDPRTWEITYILFSAKKLFTRARILISTDWVTKISWANSEIDLGLNDKQLRFQMKYTPEVTSNSDQSRIKEYLVN